MPASVLLSDARTGIRLTTDDVLHKLQFGSAADVARHIVELEVQIGDVDPDDTSSIEQAFTDWEAIVRQIAAGTF